MSERQDRPDDQPEDQVEDQVTGLPGSTAAPRPAVPETTIQFGAVDVGDVDALAPVGLGAEDVAAVQALPPTSALLVVQRGPSAGARFLLDADRTVAGRSTHADIFLDDVTVSRKHAEFVRQATSFTVRDVGSLNGTYVNRTRIDEAVLRAGDEVQIGKYRLTFHPSPARGQGQG